MVDVFDAYNRRLVHSEVLLTAKADAVQLAVQYALEILGGQPRMADESEIDNDRGSQSLDRESREFVRGAGMKDVCTMAHQPQSNDLNERFHCTFREEVPLDPEDDLCPAQERIPEFRKYYNDHGPYSALKSLRPMDYCRSNPEARFAERDKKVEEATE